jgi:hypothetical protein
MTDISTNRPLRVSTDGTAGPYIMVPLDQLEDVRHALDGKGVRYWVDEVAISVDERPFIATINLGRAGDASAVQAILDNVR